MERFQFGKINLIILILALVLILVGYLILYSGDRTISPVILVLSYVVLIPLAFIIKPNGKN